MSQSAENDRYGFLSSDGYPEEGPNPLIKPPPSAENDARQVWCVAYQDERGVYMDGPRSIRTSEFQTLRGAEDALDIIERRSGNDPKRDLRIETRFVTEWTRVLPPEKKEES